MKDTMYPEKPEDYETAIPIDKKVLRAEIERMIEGGSSSDDVSNYEPLFWLAKNKQLQKENKPTIVKCTCPIQIHTKKRDKKKGLIVMKKQNNGYFPHCPIHTKL